MRLVEPVDRKEGEDRLVNEEWQRPARAGVYDWCTEPSVRLLIMFIWTRSFRYDKSLLQLRVSWRQHPLPWCWCDFKQICSNYRHYPEAKCNDVLRLVLRNYTRVAPDSGCWWGSLRERGHWGDQDVDGRIILRWIFRKLEGVVGTGWSWFRIGTDGWH